MNQRHAKTSRRIKIDNQIAQLSQGHQEIQHPDSIINHGSVSNNGVLEDPTPLIPSKPTDVSKSESVSYKDENAAQMAQDVKEIESSIIDTPVERQRQSSVELPVLQFLKQPSTVKDANLNEIIQKKSSIMEK